MSRKILLVRRQKYWGSRPSGYRIVRGKIAKKYWGSRLVGYRNVEKNIACFVDKI
jgi:CRISPR/Cas system CSM-associated protein Csm3 (group 7 of RAMP superfamily)